MVSAPLAPPPDASISDHATADDARQRRGFGPRIRRLHGRIGRAHHQAEGMTFSRSLLSGEATPLQLAALVRALEPAYAFLEEHAPSVAAPLGADVLPWQQLSRRAVLQRDVASLAALPATPASPAASAWLKRLQELAERSPHRLMAHVYVRYGGDLSGGQQLAEQANQILAAEALPALRFWHFEQPIGALKAALHDGFEALTLTDTQEQELLEESEAAFLLTQRLLAELAELQGTASLDQGSSSSASRCCEAPLPVAAAVADSGPTREVDRALALLLKHDRPVPRYTSYPTAAAFSEAVGPADLTRQLQQPGEDPLSLYVHVPFCRHACWYCGCNRVTTQAGSRAVSPYLDALERELELVERQGGTRRPLAQLHWGGGTPNYLNNEEIGRLWDLVASRFELQSDLEASIEVNPELLDRDAVLHLRRLGFRRISFGIQDADPLVQRAVNRVVPVDQLRRAMAWMREADFQSINVDLICGLPLQTPERFRTTLELVRELRPDRISLFSFAYLPDQLPMQRRINATDLPSQRQRLAMLEEAHRLLTAQGWEAIGMDHYALAGDSLAVAARQGRLHRNFQGYTTGGELDLLGIGPTAISMFPNLYCQNQRDLRAWSRALEQGELPVERGLTVQDPDVIERRELIREVMCHFRVELDLDRFQQEWSDLQSLAADGLVCLQRNGHRGQVDVTTSGRWLIRTVAAVFDPTQRSRASGSRLI